MQIRAALAEDLATIEGLFQQVDALHSERLPDRFRLGAGPLRAKEHVLGLIQGPASAVLIAEDEDDGEALGFVQLVVTDPPAVPRFVPRRFAVVENLVVASSARRRGVGRALMEAADAWARERGATTIELTAYAVNDEATTFYQSLGFHVLSYRLTRKLG